jgi:hypothetical protein
MSVLQSNQLNDLQKASKEQLSGSVHSVGSHHSSTSLSYDSLLSSKYSGARQYTTEKPAVSFSLTMTSLQETTDGANNDSESTLGSIVRVRLLRIICENDMNTIFILNYALIRFHHG